MLRRCATLEIQHIQPTNQIINQSGPNQIKTDQTHLPHYRRPQHHQYDDDDNDDDDNDDGGGGDMAARNRPPRTLPKEEADAHEERDLWSRIINDLKDQTRQSKRISELAEEIAIAESKLEADDGTTPIHSYPPKCLR